MQVFHPHVRRRRAIGAMAALFLGLGSLGAAFFRTQIVQNEAYSQQSEMNRLRPMMLPAPRGTIYDRNGRIIADNMPGYTLSLLPAPTDSLERTLERLAPLVSLPPDGVAAALARHRRAPAFPVVVATDLSFDQVSRLEERRDMLPGIFIDMRPKRRYTGGPAIAHLVGYTAEISERELGEAEFAGYTQGQQVGKAGLEREYQHLLAGKPGFRYVKVDARGHLVGRFRPRPQQPPVPGQDLHLYLDLPLQEFVAHIFPDSMRGAIVAMEPGTGHVLAIYSKPAYDPNDFIGGVSTKVWRGLRDDPAKPLLQRASAGLYPPGSTFKLATAAIGLELGVIDAKAVMPIPCRGGMQFGDRYFRCWDRKGHGFVTLPDAIKLSCDVYFYQLGLKIGLDRFTAEGTRLGFSEKTGIDLPVERAGNFPDSPDWYRRHFGWKPTSAEVLSLAIGQGPNDQTPLKMAQFYAALAADGRVRSPRIAAVGDSGQVWDLHISKESLGWLREGLRRVVASGGTAGLSRLEHWDLLGKTGTAQNSHGADHAWFVGMAGPRGGDPEVVVAALVEAGAHGSEAAQYAAKAADYYLREKYHMPIDTIQTLKEHLLAGKPAPWAQ